METLFLTLLFLSIILLFLTPYLKSGIIFAVISLVSYYYFAALDDWSAIFLLTVGLIIIISEIFIPDFGLLGLLGFISIIYGLYLTTGDIGKIITDLTIALSAASIFFIFLFKKGYTFTNWNRFVLDTKIKSDEVIQIEKKEEKLTVGMIGKSTTALRPSGKALFSNIKMTFDVLSDDGHIANNTEIIIQEIIGNKIIVRKK